MKKALVVITLSLSLSSLVSRLSSQTLSDITTLIESGHYTAAKLALDRMKDDSPARQELQYVCDYYLGNDALLRANEKSLSNRLLAMKSNLLTKHGHYEEAIRLKDDVNTAVLAPRERREALLCQTVCNGWLKYQNHDFAGALDDFNTVGDDTQFGNSITVFRADCQEKLSQPENALKTLDGALRIDDKTLASQASRIRGEALYDLGRYVEAITPLFSSDNSDRVARYKLGMAYLQTRQYDKAAAQLSLSGGGENDRMAQSAMLNSAIAYLQSGNRTQARMAFQRASEMTADARLQEEALYNYALCLHEGNTMGFGESVNVFEQFLNKFPKSTYATAISRHLTEVYLTTKNYPRALQSIAKIKNPNSEILRAKQKIYYNLGTQSFNTGKYADAAKYMSQAINVGNYDAQTRADAYYWKGESEYRQHKYAEASKTLQELTQNSKLNTQNSQSSAQLSALYTLAYSYFKQKKYDKAKDCFKQFIENSTLKTQNSTPDLLADASNRLGDCCFSLKQYTEATEAYRNAESLSATDADYAIYQQALIEGLQGNYQNKINLLNKIADPSSALQSSSSSLSSSQANALYEKGRAYVQLNDNQGALTTFQRLIQLYPGTADARRAKNEVAMLYYEMGKTDDAITAYRRVIEENPNSREAQTALSSLKDIYTHLGRVNEYAELARKVGKAIDPDEYDRMVLSSAEKAVDAKDLAAAWKYYEQLAGQTSSDEMRLAAQRGMLTSAFRSGEWEKAVQVAGAVIDGAQGGAKTDPAFVNEALLMRAESYLQLKPKDKTMVKENAVKAVADLQELVRRDSVTVCGAEAVVRLAQYAYDTKQYAETERLMVRFTESDTQHYYWLARGFILLSDVYAVTGRKIEAREYLLSLRSNYTESAEINQMIEDRLKKLK